MDYHDSYYLTRLLEKEYYDSFIDFCCKLIIILLLFNMVAVVVKKRLGKIKIDLAKAKDNCKAPGDKVK